MCVHIVFVADEFSYEGKTITDYPVNTGKPVTHLYRIVPDTLRNDTGQWTVVANPFYWNVTRSMCKLNHRQKLHRQTTERNLSYRCRVKIPVVLTVIHKHTISVSLWVLYSIIDHEISTQIGFWKFKYIQMVKFWWKDS